MKRNGVQRALGATGIATVWFMSGDAAAQAVAAVAFGSDLCPSGCSMIDQDGDGIPDDYDACPSEKETLNGFEDGDGCPDTTQAEMVQVAQRVFFETGRYYLRADATAVLEKLARQLQALGETSGVIELVGRADSRGDPAANQRLSERRAETVLKWLVKHGVAENKVRAVGAGSIPGTDPEIMAANRRVELRADLERRRGLGREATIPPVRLQSNWELQGTESRDRSEIVSPERLRYTVYAAVNTDDRLAVYGRNAAGREVDLIVARRRGEAVRATVRERGAVQIGSTEPAPVVRQATVGEAGAPPLLPYPPPPRECGDCGEGTPVLIMAKPRPGPQQGSVPIDVGVLGTKVGMGQGALGIRLSLNHESLPDVHTWVLWDARPRTLEFVRPESNILRGELVGPGEETLAGEHHPAPVKFSTDANPCEEGTAFVTGGSYTWIDTQAKPGEASEHLLPTIRLSDLCIDQRRVSAKAYFECHSKGACPALGSGAACARIDADGFANCITRSAAEAYCKSLKARLPTEEEWEVAVTAAEAGRLAPGSQLANRETRLAVRRVLQTSNDADVSLGNVGADDTWEWTASAHNRVPGGPANSGTAVIRRRGRAPEEQSGWTLYRHAADPASQSAKVGFRCVR